MVLTSRGNLFAWKISVSNGWFSLVREGGVRTLKSPLVKRPMSSTVLNLMSVRACAHLVHTLSWTTQPSRDRFQRWKSAQTQAYLRKTCAAFFLKPLGPLNSTAFSARFWAPQPLVRAFFQNGCVCSAPMFHAQRTESRRDLSSTVRSYTYLYTTKSGRVKRIARERSRSGNPFKPRDRHKSDTRAPRQRKTKGRSATRLLTNPAKRGI